MDGIGFDGELSAKQESLRKFAAANIDDPIV